MKINEGDVVLINVKWTERSIFSVNNFNKIQRVIVKEILGKKIFKGTYNVPEKYSWINSTFQISEIIEKTKHGKVYECCEDCALAYDKNFIPDGLSNLFKFKDKDRDPFRIKIEKTFKN